MSRRESNPGLRDGKRLSILAKSYSNRFLNSFSEHLHETATLLKLFKLFKLSYSSSHHIAIFNDLKLQFYERQISGVSKFGGIWPDLARGFHFKMLDDFSLFFTDFFTDFSTESSSFYSPCSKCVLYAHPDTSGIVPTLNEIYSLIRASDCQCQSRNSPGFVPTILQHSGIWGAADEVVHRRKKPKISPCL